MTTARSISRVDSTVEMGIVNKVESDLVVYRDADKCYVLDQVQAEKKSCSYLYWLNSLSWFLNELGVVPATTFVTPITLLFSTAL